MKRRKFIAALGGAAAFPFAARAQPSKLPVVGFLNSASPGGYAPMLAGFRQGLAQSGYVEGKTVAIEYRWAEGRTDRLPAMAADLVRPQVAVIAATSTPAALAAKAATTNIPIVFETGDDPIRLGLVTSLNQPGRNITGVTQSNIEVAPKRLELLHELLPTAKVMALLVNPIDQAILAELNIKDLQAAARTLGLQLHVVNANTERDFDAAFAKVVQLRAGGLVIGGGSFFISRSEQLAALSVGHAVPAIFQGHAFAAAGGLLSYGSDITNAYRLAGVYTGRILKGDKPADLPVQQATKIELVINLKTAKALGLTVPLMLLGRADEVIE